MQKNNNDLFELMTKMYSEMQGINTRLGSVEHKLSNVEDRLSNVEDQVKKNTQSIISLENDLKPKVTALFDGYTQHTEQLKRIEQKVTMHDKVILTKVK